MEFRPVDIACRLIEAVCTYVIHSPDNLMWPGKEERIFDQPLIGFSSGADPLYNEFRNHIGEFYRTPLDLFAGTFKGRRVEPRDLTVISWILPSTKRTRQEQAQCTKHPCERWVRTRALGEEFNNQLRRFLVEFFAGKDIPAVAPLLSHLWKRYDEGPYAPCSNWSERHAAYAAGLGTFGLCDGLITPAGKAVRVGSVIAEFVLPPGKRPYDHHHAYCLHFSHDTCRKCIGRCPVGALNSQGHDKKRCMAYTEKAMNTFIKRKFALDTYACGLCQAGVPCTSAVPLFPQE